jgi:hypothetical protein
MVAIDLVAIARTSSAVSAPSQKVAVESALDVRLLLVMKASADNSTRFRTPPTLCTSKYIFWRSDCAKCIITKVPKSPAHHHPIIHMPFAGKPSLNLYNLYIRVVSGRPEETIVYLYRRKKNTSCGPLQAVGDP